MSKLEKTVAFNLKPPTNKYAAIRPYCTKHSRAMIDIGGEKKCITCEAEKQKESK